MNFQPELAAKVMAGEKTVTRRLVSANPRSPWWREQCSLQVDHTYAVCPGRGKHAIGRVRIVSTRVERLGSAFGDTLNVDDRPLGALNEAHREGFRDVGAFKVTWLKINGDYDPAALVWRVEFEVVPAEELALWERAA